MKVIKTFALASTIAASLAGSALANTTVYIHVVGAPAFRQPVNDAIETVVESFDRTDTTAGLTATTATSIPPVGSRLQNSTIESAKQNQWLIQNFVPGSIDLVINASFTGSTAGVESVSGGSGTNGGVTLSQKFIPDADATAAHLGSTSGNSNAALVTSSGEVAIAPDNDWITASDTFQASTLFNGSQTFSTASGRGSSFTFNYQTLVADLKGTSGYGHPVGVEVYHWVVSPGAPSDFTNITTLQANELYADGSLPLSYFTGNHADAGTTVYALSRDPGSGARTVALAEIGLQAPGTNTAITTFAPTITAGSGKLDSQGSVVGGTITSFSAATAGKVPSTQIYEPSGDTGFASFGTSTNGGASSTADTSSGNIGLLQAITAAPPANTLFVTYLDNDDTNEALAASNASPATGGSAKLLTYNGVTAGTTDGQSDPAVAEGAYTFWSYESFLAPTAQDSTAASFEAQLETAFPQFATLEFTQLNVTRSADGQAGDDFTQVQ